jgi:DNA-binding CsgD family transcriptional regulator
MPAPSIKTLAAAGLPAARERMTRIFARVPFVQAIDDDAFAIHDLFREFVAAQTISDPAGTGGVAARMGSALVAGGNPADGLRLLIGTADVEGVKDTLAEHAFELLETGQRSAVGAAITFLTERGFGDDGIVLAIRGAFSYFDGSGSNAANLLARALRRNLPSQMRCEVVGRLALSYSNGGDGRAALKVLAPACNDPTMNPEDQLYTRALFLAIRAVNGEHTGIAPEMAECERAVSTVTPRIQARVLQRLAYASYYTGDLAGAERLALSAAQLAAELSMDALTATCFAMLYNIATQVDRNTQRARAFLRAQAAAAERAANTALRVNALQNEFILTAVNAESEAAHTIETLLAKLTDSRTYRNTWGVVIGRALLHVAAGNVKQAEATLASPTSGLLPAEQAFCDALLVLLMLARGDRTNAAHALERGLLVEAAGDHHSIVFLNCAYALRALAFWMLDRPLQARRSFGFDVTLLPQHYRILVEGLRSLIELPHPLPNRDAAAAVCREFEEADFGGYAVLVRCLVARDANEVALSATEIETLRVFDRYGGRATDVAKALGKSKFTVQNQIQSAIKKIGCSGRAEALAYARQRGWLDATDG